MSCEPRATSRVEVDQVLMRWIFEKQLYHQRNSLQVSSCLAYIPIQQNKLKSIAHTLSVSACGDEAELNVSEHWICSHTVQCLEMFLISHCKGALLFKLL